MYVLKHGHKVFLADLRSSKLRASYELWHSRLGHAAFYTISILSKLAHLSFSSLLPKPGICSSCQLSKSKHLSFDVNVKRSLHVLDLVHCDLWGPTPVSSTDGYRYYCIFIDDFSRFSWFYLLKRKSDFFEVFQAFLAFVQT